MPLTHSSTFIVTHLHGTHLLSYVHQAYRMSKLGSGSGYYSRVYWSIPLGYNGTTKGGLLSFLRFYSERLMREMSV